MRTLSIDMRPESFSDMIGSEKTIKSIQNVLSGGQKPVAWLFSGPPGTGKTTLAKIVARELQGTDAGETTHVNVAETNGVDALREMVGASEYHPMVGNCRVVILDEAHQLTAQAQNCLLVPTENPDSPTVWIFCTTEPAKLLPALRTRCMEFVIKPMTAEQLDLLATRAAEKLGKDPIPNFGELAVRSGVTGPRDALMCLEKIFSGMEPKQALFRPEHAPEYAALARTVLSGNWTETQEALKLVRSADIGGLRSVLAAFFRNYLLKYLPSHKTDAVAAALVEMGNPPPHEQGVAYAVLTAILYRLAQKMV